MVGNNSEQIIRAIKAINAGGEAALSIALIAELQVNESKAKGNLTPEEFERLEEIYSWMQFDNELKVMGKKEFDDLAFSVILALDEAAPYVKYTYNDPEQAAQALKTIREKGHKAYVPPTLRIEVFEGKKKKTNCFLTLLSWMILPVCYMLVYWLGSLATSLVAQVIGEIRMLSTITKIFVYFVGGGVMIGLVLAPITYGGPLTVAASEAIATSENGVRYVVFATVVITITAVSFILTAIMGTINIAAIYVVIYCISVLISGRSFKEI